MVLLRVKCHVINIATVTLDRQKRIAVDPKRFQKLADRSDCSQRFKRAAFCHSTEETKLCLTFV